MNQPEMIPARDIRLVRRPASGSQYTILIEMPPGMLPEISPYVAGTYSGQKGIWLDNDVVDELRKKFGYSRELLLTELRAFDHMSQDMDEKVFYADARF